MVLQRESFDEDLEHFEDINDENETQPIEASKLEQNESSINNGVKEVDGDKVSSSEEEAADVSADLDDDDDDDDYELLLRNNTDDIPKSCAPSNTNVEKAQVSFGVTFLPGGYNPRHREPSFCNADRASWWELTVLASHAHPSVATMAGTILSGANIVYNGNPLVDLSLTAFLDKFMEKKPKQSTWHGSQIEPSQQLDMNHHLIGAEILSLAETDVPPEDQVFHKFYMNKMSSSKKSKKKKKKTAEEEDAEELYNVDGDDVVEAGDESDNEEVEKLLGSGDLEMEVHSDYDYDDLDKVADEDDSDLAVDGETDHDIAEGEEEFDLDDEDGMKDGGIDDDDHDDDDVDDDDGSHKKRKRKTNPRKKSSQSPFASLEEYEHLLKDDDDVPKPPKRRKDTNKPLRKKKKKLSS